MFLRQLNFQPFCAIPVASYAGAGVQQPSVRIGRQHKPAALLKKRFKIMVLMPLAVQRGGGELMFLDLIEHGRDLNVDWFVVFTSDGPMVQTVRNWGVEAVVIPAGRVRQPHRIASTVIKIRRIMKEKRVDAVIS